MTENTTDPDHQRDPRPALPARPGTLAVFLAGAGPVTTPVEAWDDEGHPLVLGRGGRLSRATDHPDFDHINTNGATGGTSGTDPVQLIPGGGWAVDQRFPAQGGDPAFGVVGLRVIAWALCLDGSVRPVVADLGSGVAEVLSEFEDYEFTVAHPDDD